MKSWPRATASRSATTMTRFASPANRSNTTSILLALGLAPGGVLLVHRLAGDPQRRGDLLPGPAVLPRVVDVQALQLVGQPPQREHRLQPDRGIATGHPADHIWRNHAVRVP